jgi:AhpD family alkylhydroperoxidase
MSMLATTSRRTRATLPVVIAAAFAAVIAGALAPSLPASSAETLTRDRILAEVESTVGFVPTFIRQMPAASLPVAWQGWKSLELGETALPAKTKYLISLAVAAQIPCQYCIWADTVSAKANGATDEEIGEAVGVAAMTRFWSTNLNGLQADFDLFKKELGGEVAAK